VESAEERRGPQRDVMAPNTAPYTWDATPGGNPRITTALSSLTPGWELAEGLLRRWGEATGAVRGEEATPETWEESDGSTGLTGRLTSTLAVGASCAAGSAILSLRGQETMGV
jgi:hypothetical protein